jgi:Cytochrome c554 and c-prime
MRRSSLRRAAASALALFAAGAPRLLAAPPGAPPATAPAAAPPTVLAPQPASAAAGLYLGVATCASASCHGGTRPRQSFRVLQNEYYTWLNRDPHSQAYNRLLDERSERIARNLRLDRPPAESPLCLACHALAPARAERAGRLDVEDGVSCESCHGPSSGWRAGHTEEGWSHAQSVASGMADLRDPEVRARTCLACHLGAADRTVDHELIASGHPELVFELDNYAESVSHWLPRPPDEVVAAWAVGQVESFEQGLEQLARRARDGSWPEFSDMSCDACHHSLASGAWRQRRGFSHRPGSPPWSPARWVVLRRLVDLVAPQQRAALDRQVERLSASVSRLAVPGEVAAAAEELSQSIAPLAGRLAAVSWDEARVRRVAAAVAGDSDTLARADYESAQQAAWALQTLASSLVRRDPALVGSGLIESVDRVFAGLQDRDSFDAQRFAAALAAVAREVRPR